MNRRGRRFAVLAILLFLLSPCTGKPSYREILRREHLEAKFELLSSRNLLRNFRAADSANVSAACARDLSAYDKAIADGETWACEMLDASSKVPSGLLNGYIHDLGNYAECLGTSGQVRARHCIFAINPTHGDSALLHKPLLALCLPSSCQAEDVYGLVNATINATSALRDLNVSVDMAVCSQDELRSYANTEFIVWISILGAYVGFLLACTGCDLALRSATFAEVKSSGRSEAMASLARFSFLKNAEEVLSMEPPAANVPVINGLRCFSSAFMLINHICYLQVFGVNSNILEISEWSTTWSFALVYVIAYSVDTFFTLSGLFVAYNFFSHISGTGKFNPQRYYAHRVLRLTPPVAALLVISLVIFPRLASGPLWSWMLGIFIEPARTSWWPVLLYVQNFVDADKYRLFHLWFISADMQLYLLSPLILYPIYKKPKIGLIALLALVAASILGNAYIVGKHGLPSSIIFREPNITRAEEALHVIYYPSYTRASSWLIGVFLACMLINKTIKLNKMTVYLGWSFVAITIASFLYIIKIIMSPSYEYDRTLEVLFAAFHRPVWSLMISWVIYACLNDAGGVVTKILSFKIFLPLSKLSYSFYLVHTLFPLLRIGRPNFPNDFSLYSTMEFFIADLVLATIAAFFFSVLFERPALIVDSLIFRKKAVESPKEAPKTE